LVPYEQSRADKGANRLLKGRQESTKAVQKPGKKYRINFINIIDRPSRDVSALKKGEEETGAERLREIKDLERKNKNITLLFGAKDEKHNQAVVLKEVLDSFR
jgi:Uncharacterized conserved protein